MDGRRGTIGQTDIFAPRVLPRAMSWSRTVFSLFASFDQSEPVAKQGSTLAVRSSHGPTGGTGGMTSGAGLI
jgi:hypothetical protein